MQPLWCCWCSRNSAEKKGVWITKIHIKGGLHSETQIACRYGLPGGEPAGPYWDLQGRWSHQANYWLVPTSSYETLSTDGPGPGPGPGQSSSLAARWVNRHTAHQTHCHPKQCCGRSSLKQADFFNQVVRVTFDSGVLLLPRHTSSATPSIYCQLELDWKTSGTRTPSSALSCVVKANLTPVKTKFYN